MFFLSTFRRIVVLFATSMVLASVVAAQEARPVFGVTVPDSTLPDSQSSSLNSRIGDAAGNTLYIIDHFSTPANIIVGAIPVGKQLLLVSSTGKLIGSADLPFPAAAIVHFFSTRRMLLQNNSGTVEEFRPVNGRLISTGVVLSANGRSFHSQDPDILGRGRKFIDAVSSTNGKIALIERFTVSKLSPSP